MVTVRIITTLRNTKGWSRVNLADNRGVSRVNIGTHERSEFVPYIDSDNQIAVDLKVSSDYLVGKGQSRGSNKKTTQQHNLEVLNPTIIDKLFF